MARRWDKSYDEVRSIILGSAAGLLSGRGVAATSLQQVADAAGMSKGTLNYYYPSKEMLIHDVGEEHISELTRRLLDWISSLTRSLSYAQAKEILMDKLFPPDSAGEAFARLHIVLLHEIAMGNASLARRFKARAQEWRAMVEVGALKVLGPQSDKFSDIEQNIFATINSYAIERLALLE